MTKRRQISLLPQVHQTDALKRFFDSTVEQVFQAGKTVPVSGYIGRKPSHYNPELDFYKPEPSLSRAKYQLEPMMVSQRNGRVLSTLFYEDLLARLSQAGALIDDPNRLFRAGYYSWAPPIDIDRIMNFQQYYWAGSQTTALVLTVPGVEVGTRVYSDGNQRKIAIPPRLPSRLVSEENITVLIDGLVTSQFTRSGEFVVLSEKPARDSIVVVFRYGNVANGERDIFAVPPHCPASQGLDTVYVYINGRETTDFTINGDESVSLLSPPPANSHVMVTRIKDLAAMIEGRTQFDPTGLVTSPVHALVDGMKIKIVDPTNFLIGYDLKAYGHPWDEMNYSTYFVEGVDLSIALVPLDNISISGDGSDGDETRYIVVARKDKSRSYWSRINRWVHKDALLSLADATYENRAKRPIIEFTEDLQQFNYGNYRVQNTSAKVSDSPLYNGERIAFTEINGLPVGSVVIDNGFVPARGNVLVINLPNSPLNSTLYYVDVVDNSEGEGKLYLLEPLLDVTEGAVTNIGVNEHWFDGRMWNAVAAPGDYPLFDLFDSDGVSLGDEGVYQGTNFSGSRLFNFAKGTGFTDSEIKRKLVHDKYGQIVFENELETTTYSYEGGVIEGYYYYISQGRFANMWHRASDELAQQIDANNISELPLNLQANPDFATPEFLSKNDFFTHFSSIIENQDGFVGQSFSHNNWNLTAKDVSKGLVIIQHEAPLLKLMALMETDELSLLKALRFADREYTRFKANFLKHALQVTRDGDTSNLSNDALAELALSRVNAGKSSTFPFADSTIGGGKYFLPSTPALLGISPLAKPTRYRDEAGVEYLRGHDGSSTALFGDQRDDALAGLEQKIYDHADPVSDLMPLYDLLSGNYRPTGQYSEEEVTRLLTPLFEQWARENGHSLAVNAEFSETDPFSFNYSSSSDRFGNSLPGGWRAIYRHFFDTETPNRTPWEMLGFTSEPSWWQTSYGQAPYSRDNSILWDDIEAGIIQSGERAGTYAKFARPGLMQILPVDQHGSLIDPIAATIVKNLPPVQFARQGWQFGDGSPVEAAWRQSPSYQFALAYAKFLMRPNFFVERFWDISHERLVHDDQIVDSISLKRNKHADLFVNTETRPNGEKQVTRGVQNWIVNRLINRGISPALLGETIRGLRTQLGHKVAGFTTSDRMTVSAESFGLVPGEDISINLYRSPSVEDFSYSGILIENVSGGWRVVGYNPDQPYFTSLVRDTSSRKNVLLSDSSATEQVINPWTANVYYKLDMMVEYKSAVYSCRAPHTSSGKFESTFWNLDTSATQRKATKVFRYAKSTGEVEVIPYGTTLASKQEVANLMFGYEAYLAQQGFVFTDVEDAPNSWTTAVRNFLRWSEINWSDGSFVTLSPSARELTFQTDTGLIAEISDVVLGRSGHTLKSQDFNVDRFEDTTVISAVTEDIYSARLSRVEVEHCLIFNNVTIFDDVIYNALYNIRQDRLKLSAKLASDWTGRYSAPGFVLEGNDMAPNFVKLGEDIREMFDIEQADNTVLRDHARHVIGFESRNYLSRLLVSETQQFELYQGMIQQKGSGSSLSTLLRSVQIGQNRNLKFLEEWAFRLGEYGAYHPVQRGEFTIQQTDIHNQRQIISFGSLDQPRWLNARDQIVSTPFDFSSLLTASPRESLADGGYVRIDEADYISRNHETFGQIVTDTDSVLEGEKVWLTHEDEWVIGRLSYPTADHAEITITRVDDEYSGASDDVFDYRIWFDRPHDLKVADGFFLTSGSKEEFRGQHVVLRVGPDWIEVDGLSQAIYEIIGEMPPTILRIDSLRAKTIAERDAIPYADSLAYVDGTAWVVYRKLAGDWIEVRRQGKRIDNQQVTSVVVYDPAAVLTNDRLEVQPAIISNVVILDPLSGLIPGIADRELDYKLEYDPADYSTWGAEEIGKLWWNLDTARFVNCYTDAVEEMDETSTRYAEEIAYRTTQWARLLPSSTVDVYEWVRSATPPEGIYSYTTRHEYDNRLLRTSDFYYYWSLNPTSVPLSGDRRLSAYSVSRLISNPDLSGFVWTAPLTDKTMLLSGAKPYLTDVDSIVQISFQRTDYQGPEHTEWALMRPLDEATPPIPALWERLVTSLVGFTQDGVSVPSVDLHSQNRCGLAQGQSLFGDIPVREGRKSFIRMLNFILARKNLSYIGSLEKKLSQADEPTDYSFWSQHSGDPAILPLASEYDAIAYSESERDLALKGVDRVLLDNRQGAVPSFSIWESDADGKPQLSRAYDYAVDTIAERDALFPSLDYKDRVLVRSDDRADGFWTIWRKNGEGAWAIDPFEKFKYDGFTGVTLGLVAAQKYRTRDLWDYTDWYSDTVSADRPPSVIYATIADRVIGEGENPQNLLVKIDDDAGYWSWTAYTGKEWITVARENGTIQFKEDFFTSQHRYGFDGNEMTYDITQIRNRDGSLDLAPLLAAAHVALSPLDLNELWFSMIHFVHSKIEKIDWASKTSFVSVLGYNERLWQAPVAINDNLPLLMEYVDEVKPYRTKIREVIQTAAPDIDVANTIATDFGKPVYYDNRLDAYRRLDDNIDADILSSGLYRHRTLNPDKVRKTKVGLLFDRIWDTVGDNSGAASRIMAYYQPGSNMRAKSLDELMGLDFKGTVYDGKTLADVDADVLLRGSDAASSLEAVTGLNLRDPHAFGKPEEMVKMGSTDGLVIRFHDRWGDGAPLHTVRHYDVSRRKSDTGSFDINAVPDSIAVFRDGVRAPASAYTLNAITNMAEVDLIVNESRVNTVAIHAFGFAAVNPIVDQQFYAGGGTFEMPEAFSGKLAVQVNGQPVADAEISVDLNTVSLSRNLTASDAVMITRYSSDDPKPIQMKTTQLPYNANKIWTLTDLPEQRPYHAGVIVEVNGLRLTPPKTLYVSNDLSIFVGTDDVSKLRVYDSLTEEGFEVVDFSTISTDDFKEPVDVIAQMGDTRFALWNQRVVFADLDASGRDYVVVNNDRNQFTISDTGVLSISRPLSAEDRIEVTGWDNGTTMEVRSHVYRGSARGIYPLRTRNRGRSWLTLNGRRLIENVDYVITGYAGGAWDIDPFEAYTYDAFTDVQIALRLPAEADGADLVITTFEGRENNPAGSWQLSTKAPSEMRFLPVAEGEPVLYLVKDAWEMIALDEKRRSAGLDSNISQEGETISMTLNPLGLPVSMIPSQPMAVPTSKTPGVIWIGAERIEYFDYQRSGDSLEIGQLRRGTRGTAKLNHEAGTLIYAGDAILDRLPPCPRGIPGGCNIC